MASKQVVDRQKGADAVLAIFDAQGGTLADAAGRVLGTEPQSIRTTLDVLQKALQGRRDAMLHADEAHESELADDPSARDARDAAFAQFKDKVVELRSVITGMYSAQAARDVMAGNTPQDPVALERFAGEIIKNLDTVTWPKPRFAGAALDTKALQADLSSAREALQGALGQVASEAREAQDSLAKKNQAIEEYDRVFTGVATSLAGLFTLTGEQELADKVRPSTRRLGQTIEQVAAEG